MDNTRFNKRLKIGAIVFALILVILLIMGFSKNNNYDCINNDNYAADLTFEEAIKMLYAKYDIKEDPRKYKNYEESIKGRYEEWESFEWDFQSIDNYRLFLSDDAECNQGEESLKSFICKFLSNMSFLKNRISLCKKELLWFDIKDIPTFRFVFDHDDGAVASWVSLEDNRASYRICVGMEWAESYDFARVGGKWYLIGYFDYSYMDIY